MQIIVFFSLLNINITNNCSIRDLFYVVSIEFQLQTNMLACTTHLHIYILVLFWYIYFINKLSIRKPKLILVPHTFSSGRSQNIRMLQRRRKCNSGATLQINVY